MGEGSGVGLHCGEEDEAEWRFACRAHGLYFSAPTFKWAGKINNT
jgi:hypothetical protein